MFELKSGAAMAALAAPMLPPLYEGVSHGKFACVTIKLGRTVRRSVN